MELISGIISGVLLLTLLVVLPIGIRARRRDLKEVAQLGSQLEERTRLLVEAVESLTGEKEIGPTADEAYSVGYRWVDIQSAVPLEEDFGAFRKNYSVIETEERLKIIKIYDMDIAPENVEKTIGEGGYWDLLTPRYPLVDKERSYAR